KGKNEFHFRGDEVPPLMGNLSPENSWSEYQCFVRFEEDSSVVVHKPIPTESTLKAKQRQQNGVHVLRSPALAADRGLNPFATDDVPDVASVGQFKEEI